MENSEKTFDVVFHSSNSSSAKGFEQTLEYCIDYIKTWNGTNNSYFEDYKGGVVVVVQNDTDGDPVYSETIPA